jgi:hypothetical protein
VHVSGDDVPEATVDEGWATTRQLEQDAAKRVDVRTRIGGARAAALLGRHVVGRPHHQAGAGPHAGGLSVAGELGDAKVVHLHALATDHLGIRDQEQVVGLEIAVRDAGVVRGLQYVCDLAADPAALVIIVPPLLEPRGEGLALEELHHKVRAAIGSGADVEDLHDAWVADGGRGLGFGEESLHDVGMARQFGMQHLHGDALPERLVAADVDDAHGARAELLHDPIIAEQHPLHANPQSTRGHGLSRTAAVALGVWKLCWSDRAPA